MFSRSDNRIDILGHSDSEGETQDVPLAPSVDPSAITPAGVVEVSWNPDGSFEDLRQAASRSGQAPPPPGRFEDASILEPPSGSTVAEQPELDDATVPVVGPVALGDGLDGP